MFRKLFCRSLIIVHWQISKQLLYVTSHSHISSPYELLYVDGFVGHWLVSTIVVYSVCVFYTHDNFNVLQLIRRTLMYSSRLSCLELCAFTVETNVVLASAEYANVSCIGTIEQQMCSRVDCVQLHLTGLWWLVDCVQLHLTGLWWLVDYVQLHLTGLWWLFSSHVDRQWSLRRRLQCKQDCRVWALCPVPSTLS